MEDDGRLLQGATTSPPPLQSVKDWQVEGADPIGFCFWHGRWTESESDMRRVAGRKVPATVAEVEEFFAQVCFECDRIMGELAVCRWFLNWYDDTPRDEMRRCLLPEVEREIARRYS